MKETIVIHKVRDHFVIDLSHFCPRGFGGYFGFGLVFEVPEAEYFWVSFPALCMRVTPVVTNDKNTTGENRSVIKYQVVHFTALGTGPVLEKVLSLWTE